jgi:hypothetical protein
VGTKTRLFRVGRLIIIVSPKPYVDVPFCGAILTLEDLATADSTLDPYLRFFGIIL